GNGVGVEDRHDPLWHAYFQDSRSSFVGEERVLVLCGHFWGARAARAPIADDGRKAFCRREAPRSRFPVVRIWTICLDCAGSLERRPVMENGRWEIGCQGGSPRSYPLLQVEWAFVELAWRPTGSPLVRPSAGRGGTSPRGGRMAEGNPLLLLIIC